MCSDEVFSNIVNFPARSAIIREGEEDRKLYVLLEGKCTVYKGGVEIASFDEEGTFFGEMGMILGVPRPATVKAATDVEICILEVDLDTMLTNYPNMTKRILHTLAQRLADQTERLFTLLWTADLKELSLNK